MQPSMPPRIAVIADAHFHDLYGDYGLSDDKGAAPAMAVRRLAETARSTRVFNESHSALCHTLNDIAARKIKHVILLGDYSDDGQIATLSGLRRILDGYALRFGMRFFATVGNHDIFGPDGRHRTKRFLNHEGGYDIATSNPRFDDPAAGRIVVSDAMYCRGYPAGLNALPDLGFFATPTDLHWETPFGDRNNSYSRLYPVISDEAKPYPPLMDASYLIEPFLGVWVMMIDANVFRPFTQSEFGKHDEDFADSTTAGWNAMLTHKPFVLAWMKDVAARAATLGKQLLTFSHYPVLDPLDGTRDDERALLGATGLAQRIPDPTVAEAMLDTGIKVHFSGHLHVNDTARYRRDDRFIINVSVPSLVAFPGAYKIIGISDAKLDVETVEIGAMPLNPDIASLYRREISQTGLKASRLMQCADYGAFLYEHIGHLVARRHLRREWPNDLASLIPSLTLADLATLARVGHMKTVQDVMAQLATLREPDNLSALACVELSAGLAKGVLAEVSALSFLEDWYRLKMGSDIALDGIPAARLAAYRAVATLYARPISASSGEIQGRFAILFRMFSKYLSGLPSRNFRIDLETGDVRQRRL